jgi:hypothetical protein
LGILLAIYWFKGVGQKPRHKPTGDDYLLEIRNEGDVVDLTAQVPGPENKVRVELLGRDGLCFVAVWVSRGL